MFESCQASVALWMQLEIKDAEIEKGERLGKGAYAEVFKGRALDVECAIKVYRRTASGSQLEEAMREIKLAASLDHPFTLRLIGWVRNPLQTITELCKGDLKDLYKDKIEGFPYTEMRALRLLMVGRWSMDALILCFHN